MSRTLLTARAVGMVQQELADTTRWAASEQERADAIAQTRDALATTNAALLVAQAERESAYAELQCEVAARLKLENELRLAQKLESVGQLAAGIAHEINTPVQYVGDSIVFLAESFENIRILVERYRTALAQLRGTPGHAQIDQELKEAEDAADLAFVEANAPSAFARATDGVTRISTIVSAMREFAHPDDRAKNPADLNRAIETTLTITRNEYKYVAELVTEFGDLPPVPCHVGSINQVILNLLVNAAHAIGDVVGGNGKKGQILIRTVREGDMVRIDIEDTGPGVPEEVRDRIFEPFFTTKEVGKGSGQGLAIARSIVVDKHGGSLSFTSESGKGTTFTVLLPLAG
jgi:two-component system NtrC family sensor kinase